MNHERPDPQVQKEKGVFRTLVTRYRAIKRALSEALGRGDGEYSRLTALSQEIARLRNKIKTELALRRDSRMSRRKKPTSAQPLRNSREERPV